MLRGACGDWRILAKLVKFIVLGRDFSLKFASMGPNSREGNKRNMRNCKIDIRPHFVAWHIAAVNASLIPYDNAKKSGKLALGQPVGV